MPDDFEKINNAAQNWDEITVNDYVKNATYQQYLSRREKDIKQTVSDRYNYRIEQLRLANWRIEIENKKKPGHEAPLHSMDEVDIVKIEDSVRAERRYAFLTYGDFVYEYERLRIGRIAGFLGVRMDEIKEEIEKLEDGELKQRLTRYYSEIKKWETTILQMAFPTSKKFSGDVPVDETGNPVPFTRDLCRKKYLGAIDDLMNCIEQTVAKTYTGEVYNVGSGQDIQTLKGRRIRIKSLETVIPEEEKRLYECANTVLGYAHLLSMKSEQMFDGLLEVPAENITEQNGKKIHRVNAQGRDSVYANAKYSVKEDGTVTVSFSKDVNNRESDIVEEALFPSLPTTDDVMQGGLGDCYLMAALISIVQQDPEKIREAIIDNQDGTATVRFFNDDLEPVYVTVDKSFPVDNNTGKAAYARGALWVRIMEKAYAASGLKSGSRISDVEGAEQGKAIDYTEIVGGRPENVVARILGTKPGRISGEYESKDIRDFSGNQGPYTKEELELADFIDRQLKENHIVTTETHVHFHKSPEETKALREKGIFELHAYSLVGIDMEKRADGKIYIKYRNPHNKKGIIQSTKEDGSVDRPEIANVNDGIGRMELREFSRYFSDVYGNYYDLTPARVEKLPVANDMIRRYGNVVEAIRESLNNTDHLLLAAYNSKVFKDLKAAAELAVRSMQGDCPQPEMIHSSLQVLFNAAKAYTGYCDKVEKVDLNTASDRIVKRYKAAMITQGLEEIYRKNEPADKSLQSWLASESGKTEKLECDYDVLARETGIPTTGWEQISAAKKNVEQLVLHPNANRTIAERCEFYDRLRQFMDKNEFLIFEKLKGLKPNDKNLFLKKNRGALEAMTAITQYGSEICELMKRDGYSRTNSGIIDEIGVMRELLKPRMELLLADTDKTKYSGLRGLAYGGANNYRDVRASLEVQAATYDSAIARFRAENQTGKKNSKEFRKG